MKKLLQILGIVMVVLIGGCSFVSCVAVQTVDKALTETVNEMEEQSNKQQEAVDKMIAEHGKIDVLLNNAGITKDGLFIRMDMEQWERVIKINLTSAYCVTHAVIKYMMKARQGSIINMSSIVGRHGNAGQANYSASKAGLIGLTQTLAKEFGGRNIRVNAVCPGFIQTAMTAELPNIDEYLKAIPMKRLGTPEDIAKVVKFLALDTEYVTGQAIEVAGGLMI